VPFELNVALLVVTWLIVVLISVILLSASLHTAKNKPIKGRAENVNKTFIKQKCFNCIDFQLLKPLCNVQKVHFGSFKQKFFLQMDVSAIINCGTFLVPHSNQW
jgi:hypothetical protein